MGFEPHKFGRYIILDPLAVGGMAEIYRARINSSGANADGPDRVLIIKKIIASLSSNEDFVNMFEEEIKVTVGLSHPNIVQVYDYGRVDGQSFLAMEYVEGKNLRQFLKELLKSRSMFSVDMSCYIISQVSQALGYAHSYKDRLSGRHLGIVHRDISPQNILISYDGTIKLFDFGIAKAKSASEATQAGIIKGKPSYLSPEQIVGDVLDGRSDIFALGIVIWEMLTAKRLFVADNDMAILRKIQTAKIEPPSVYNPSIPPELNAIVLKALARDKNKRYQTAEELQRDLHKFLYSFNPSFNPADLSYYAKELFKKDIKQDRVRLMAAVKADPKEMKGSAPELAENPQAAKPAPAEQDYKNKEIEGLMKSTDFSRDAMESMLTTESTKGEDSEHSLEIDVEGKTKRQKIIAARAAAANSKKGGTNPPLVGSKSTPPNQIKKKGALGKAKLADGDQAIPPWANNAPTTKRAGSANTNPRISRSVNKASSLDRELSRSSSSGMGSLGVVAAAMIVFGGFAYAYFVNPEILEGTVFYEYLPKKENTIADTETEVHSRAVASKTKVIDDRVNRGEIEIMANVNNYFVIIDESKFKPKKNKFTLPVGKDYKISISKAGYKSAKFDIKLKDDSPVQVKIKLVPIEYGLLTFDTIPGSDIVLETSGHAPVETYTPLRKKKLPIGKYKIHIENQTLKHKSVYELEIKKGKLTEKVYKLQ